MQLYEIRKKLLSGQSIYNINLNVAYYARVSTDKDAQANSLENQRSHYKKLIEANPHWTLAGEYIDEGISGSNTINRAGFLQMLTDARLGKMQLIITKEISRFSRDTLDSLKFTRELLDLGVGVLFEADSINTLNPDAELRLTIMSSIAQEEVRKLSDRVKFGFLRSVEDTKALGANIYGYNKNNGVLTINPEQALIVKKLFEIYSQGQLGLKTISKQFETMGMLAPNGRAFNYATLQGIIKNPRYKGDYIGSKYSTLDHRSKKIILKPQDEWTVIKCAVPAIVTGELWEKANQVLAARGKKFATRQGGNQNRYPYSGKIYCAVHQVTFHRHTLKSNSGISECWSCSKYRLHGKEFGCDTPTLYSVELDKVLKDVYLALIGDKDWIIQELTSLYSKNTSQDSIKTRIDLLNAESLRIQAKKEKLLELSLDAFISNEEFKARNTTLNTRLQNITHELTALSQKSLALQSAATYSATLTQALTDKLADPKELTQTFLQSITVKKLPKENSIALDIYLNLSQAPSAQLLPYSNNAYEFIRKLPAKRGFYTFYIATNVFLKI